MHIAEWSQDRVGRYLQHVVGSLPLAFGVFDTQLRHVVVNDALAEMNGLPASALLGRTPSEVHGDLGHRAEQLYRRVVDTREAVLDDEIAGATHDSEGRLRHFALHYYPVLDDDEAVGVAVLVTEVTRRHEAEARLQETTELSEALIENVVDHAIVTLGPEGHIRTWNAGAEEIFGYDAEQALQRDVTELLAATGEEGGHRLGTAATTGRAEQEGWLTRADGRRLWCHTVLTSLHDEHGDLRGFTQVTRDLTHQHEAEQALRHQALHDSLTGLPNRTLFNDRLEQALGRSARLGTPTGLLLMDLNRFKEINDTLGHTVGDVVLQEVAGRLPGAVRDADTVARLGGDEFAVVLPDVGSAADAMDIARRIRHDLRPPVVVRGMELDVDASVGVALHPQDGDNAEALLQRADVAMYRAKQSSTNVCRYSPGIDSDSRERLTMVSALRRDLDAGGLWVEYQPKMELSSNNTVAVEALVRWAPRVDDSDGDGAPGGRQRVGPDVFVPLAEETDLILPLTSFVVTEAARQIADWSASGLSIRVAVNVSARLLGNVDLFDVVVAAADAAAIDPHMLELEITESALMHSHGAAEMAMRRLGALGIRFCLDDFGTGYSSLSHLRGLPIDEIKIDRSFVLGLLTTSEDETIVQTVIDLATNLGRTCVAEGIENAQVQSRLLEMGCDYGQGYHLQRPAQGRELTEVLLGHRPHG